jgi:hypothetical protein
VDELVDLERQGWDALTDGTAVEFYGRLLADDALFVVPGMVLDRAQTLASWGDGPSWRSYAFTDERVSHLGDDTALVTYDGTATRLDGSTYRARFTTIYRRDGRSWRLRFHQQTPPPAS